jgi:predicted PurR-regulated permease PerM
VSIVVALTILLIRGLGNVATPFFAAAITAYLFNPLITWLQRHTKIGRAAWIGLLYLVVGLIINLAFRFIGPIIARQYSELIANLPAMLADLQQQIDGLNLGGFELSPSGDQSVRNFLVDLGKRVPEQVPHLLGTAIETLLLLVSYLMVTYYLLLQADQIMDWAYALVPAPYRAEIRSLGQQIDQILAGYIRGTLLLIPIMSVLTFIALSALGIHYALVLAIFSGVVEIVPLIGPWSAAGTAIIVALFQNPAPFGWPHWLIAGVIGLIYFVLRISEDNFIIPHVVGSAVHLHPMLVIFAILSGGALGGAFGLFVSIPVAAIIRLLLSYFYYKLIDRDPPAPRSNHNPPEQPPPDQAQTTPTTHD